MKAAKGVSKRVSKRVAKRVAKRVSKTVAKKGKETLSEERVHGYLHGYSKEEQDRLVQQARFLEHKVYESVDLSDAKNILEIGCGVGAQTEILCDRFPHLHLTSVDTSPAQIATAKKRLHHLVQSGRVNLIHSQGESLQMEDSQFDAVFICWLLEHVPDPKKILEESKRLLRPRGKIICTEVLNSTLYLHPYSPSTLQYWFAFNDHQWSLHGDPFVGAKLGGYLHDAGYQEVSIRNLVFHYDSRSPKMRKMFFDYWKKLLLSGAPSLVGSGTVSQSLVDSMSKELNALKDDPNAVFYYSAIQAEGKVY